MVDYAKILHLVKTSLLPEQNVNCVGDCLPNESYKDHITQLNINLSEAISILDTIDATNTARPIIPKEIVLHTVLLIGEHARNEDWTSSKIISHTKQLEAIILEYSYFKDITSLILSYKVNFFLTELKPKLILSTWKKYPAAVSCFIWIVSHVKWPHLGGNINEVLPTCLLLVDDHVNDNKIKGLKCLLHLSKYVSKTDLVQYGKADVIYKAVEHMIYSRDSEIISNLSKLLVEFLSKTEHSLTTKSLLWNRFDDVLNIWLSSMEMEQSIALRESYIDSLKHFLQAMGLACTRWSNKILGVLSEYCENEHTLDKSLSCLLTFINVSWPKTSSNINSVCFILMTVIIKNYDKQATIKPSKYTDQLIRSSFDSLNKLSNKGYNELLNVLKENIKTYNCSFTFNESH